MNRRTPMYPRWQNVFNSRASLQMQGMSSGSLTGLLHNTSLTAGATHWADIIGRRQLVSDHQLVSGGMGELQRHDKWEVLHIAMHVEAEIRHANNSISRKVLGASLSKIHHCRTWIWNKQELLRKDNHGHFKSKSLECCMLSKKPPQKTQKYSYQNIQYS